MPLNESTISNDVAQTSSRLGDYLRTPSTSGDKVIRRGFQEYDWGEMASFVIRVPLDVWESDDLVNLDRILSDIEYIGRTSINESVLRAKKSSNSKRAAARKWYKKNRALLAKKRKKLAKSVEGKKRKKMKERMAKQKKNRHGKPLRKYPTAKGHTNERISFYEMVKEATDSKKFSVKANLKSKPKKRYFMAETTIELGNYRFPKNYVFTLVEDKDLIFKHENKKHIIENIPSKIFQYLTEI